MNTVAPGREYGYSDAQPSHSQLYLNSILDGIIDDLRLPSGARALDYGCGNGWFANWLSDRGFKATGADISSSGIAVAQRSFPKVSFTSDVSDSGINAEGPFDLVTCVEVIAHCFSPSKELDRIYSAMKPGGVLILSTPYHGYWKYLALALSGRMERHLDTSWSGAYVHHYTPLTISRLLKDSGFEIQRITTAGRIAPLAKSMIITCRKPT